VYAGKSEDFPDSFYIVKNCHERIKIIAPVIEVNSIEELSEVVKQLYTQL
jgi:hypothetical protein